MHHYHDIPSQRGKGAYVCHIYRVLSKSTLFVTLK